LFAIIGYVVKRGWRINSLVGWLVVFMLISTFVTGRPNRVYMVFVFCLSSDGTFFCGTGW